MVKSLTLLLLTIAFSVTFAAAQTPDAAATVQSKADNSRDIPFPTGVDLQFLIKELARDMDLNVAFDIDSFRSARKASIELRNVTPAEALNALFRQEHLVAERIDSKTILVALEARAGGSIPVGISLTYLPDQLRDYFRVPNGVLINTVKADSPAAKAGLKAGDVIVEVNGTTIQGALTLQRSIADQPRTDLSLKIIRDLKPLTITVAAPKGIGQ